MRTFEYIYITSYVYLENINNINSQMANLQTICYPCDLEN